MPETPSILSTKILDDAGRSFARAKGWRLWEESFIETTPLFRSSVPKDEEHWKNIFSGIDDQTLVIFTSENGVQSVPYSLAPTFSPGDRLPEGHPELWQIACLSGKTLRKVESRFREKQVVLHAKNATGLASATIADGRFRRAFFFCALEHRSELPQALRAAGIELKEVPVYRTTGLAKVIKETFDGVLFFSPSAVASFFSVNKLKPGAVCFAIGETTAASIKDFTNERIIISTEPSQKTLLDSVQFYYDNQQLKNDPTKK